MRKLLCIILVLVMALSCTSVVFANNIDSAITDEKLIDNFDKIANTITDPD